MWNHRSAPEFEVKLYKKKSAVSYAAILPLFMPQCCSKWEWGLIQLGTNAFSGVARTRLKTTSDCLNVFSSWLCIQYWPPPKLFLLTKARKPSLHYYYITFLKWWLFNNFVYWSNICVTLTYSCFMFLSFVIIQLVFFIICKCYINIIHCLTSVFFNFSAGCCGQYCNRQNQWFTGILHGYQWYRIR